MANVAYPGAPYVAKPISPPMAGVFGAAAEISLPIIAPATLLGSDLIADWDARAGVAATTWTDQKASIVLTATGSPTFATDGAYFNGLPVWKIVSGQQLSTGTIATFLTSSSTFSISTVCRFTSGTLANKNLWRTFTTNGTVQSWLAQALNSVARLGMTGAISIQSRVGAFDSSNTDVHRFEFAFNGARAYILLDGVDVGDGAMSQSRSSETFTMPTITANTIAINIASTRIVSPLPSANVRAQLRAYDASIWGTH